MKILVIGTGAIGIMLGTKLALTGSDVTFHDRPAVLERLSEKGARLIEEKETKTPETVKTLLHPQEGFFDLALLSVKAYGTEEIAETIPAGLFGKIVTFQNGIGNEEILTAKFGADRVLSATITLPVLKHDSTTVEITNGKGGIGFAPVGENRKEALEGQQLFAQAGFETAFYPNYRDMKWSKLILNMTANALSAITSMTMAEIFSSRNMTSLEKRAVTECLSVMGRQKIKAVDLPGYPVKMMEKLFRYASPTMIELIMSLTGRKKARGSKMPSLYIERSSGSSRSEVDVLNGAVVREAERCGAAAPANRFLQETLNGILGGKLDGKLYEHNPQRLWQDFRTYLRRCEA